MPDPREPIHRLRRSLWASVAFLLASAVLIVVIARFYLVPAMSAAKDADITGKRQLTAFSTLLLAVVLFALFVGLLMTFRIHRFFFPRHDLPGQESAQRATPHVDAWAESAKRLSVPKNANEDDWDDLD